jgi:LuxR family maltose regulon positive regulatory protein
MSASPPPTTPPARQPIPVVSIRPFAVTKLRPPNARADVVARPRLDAALTAALLQSKLVLLVAPAGFGKTVALGSCLEAMRQAGTARCVWISADEDDDLPRISACTVAALEPFKVPWKAWVSPNATASVLTGADAERRRSIANDFVNALTATEVPRGLIVIDDAHRVNDVAIFEFLDHMIERLPPHWGVVLSSRTEPPMAIGRWRGRGELAEFRQAELRFELGEVRALLSDTTDASPAMQPEALLQRTQGWAAGLRLALQARRSGGALSEQHVFDFVASEVLAEMPPAKRLFLMRCSVLPELSVARCDTVSGDPEAARWLDEIERQGLFVSARGEGSDAVLVLHDLFRDCLEHQLQRELPHELPQLLRRAVQDEPDTPRRVGFLVRAGAWAEARADLFAAAPALLTAGVVAPVHRLIEQFPATQRDAPEFQMIRGLTAWSQWDFDAMRVAMHRAVEGFAQSGQPAHRLWALAHAAIGLLASRQPRDAAPLLAELQAAVPLEGEVLVATLHALTWQAIELGPLDEVSERMARELQEIERHPLPVLWYKASPTMGFVGLPGSHAVLSHYVEGASSAAGEALSALRVLATMIQGWLAAWAGQVDVAQALLQMAADDSRWLDQAEVIGWQVAMGQAFVQALRGDAQAALQTARHRLPPPRRGMASSRRHTLESLALSIEIRLASALGLDETVRDAHQRLAQVPPPCTDRPFAKYRAALAGHAALASGDAAGAHALWREALADEGSLRLLGLDMELRTRLAHAACRGGETNEAAQWLRPALARAAADLAAAPLLMLGPAVLAGLARHDWHGALTPTEGQQLQALQRQAASHGGAPLGTRPAAPALDRREAGLTERENEILQRLVAGDSNKVIAKTFDLSPHTVKRHVENILAKLQLSSRGQVAAWFHTAQRDG